MEKALIDTIILHQTRSLPLIIDEKSALEFVSVFTGGTIDSLDSCKSGNFPNLFLYEKEEEKTYISVKVIRNWILELSEKPYGGKTLSILRYFDEATPEAMNASLKALEEPPVHALILLVVKNPESLLETIRSRCLNVYETEGQERLSEEILGAIQSFMKGDIQNLVEVNHTGKLSEGTILLILIELLKLSPEGKTPRIEACIEDLLTVHENPRNILDKALLYL